MLRDADADRTEPIPRHLQHLHGRCHPHRDRSMPVPPLILARHRTLVREVRLRLKVSATLLLSTLPPQDQRQAIKVCSKEALRNVPYQQGQLAPHVTSEHTPPEYEDLDLGAPIQVTRQVRCHEMRLRSTRIRTFCRLQNGRDWCICPWQITD